MTRLIELKHIGPKAHVRRLVDELCDRLEDKLQYVDTEAVSVHVVFEENGTHKLSRASVTCHVPHYIAAAHEEGRDPGAALRSAFKELEQQLQKHHPLHYRRLLRKKQFLERGVDARGADQVDLEQHQGS